MIEIMVALVVFFVVVMGPVAVRQLLDRREERALALRAYMGSIVNHALGGESFVSVQVTPRWPWRPGRILVSIPGGWEWLLESVWPVLLARTPAGYDLVIRPGSRAAVVAPSDAPALKRVA